MKILDDMSFELGRYGQLLGRECVSHLIKKDKIEHFSEINNVLSYLKSLLANDEPEPEPANATCSKVNAVINMLSTICDHENKGLLNFIIDQLSLFLKKKQARVYTSNLLIKSFLWHSLSPAGYSNLRNLFVLPGSRRLRQISSASLSRQTSFHVDHDYLKKRTLDLCHRDNHVILQIDEIYTAGRIEYSGGQVIGITESGAKAKTVLAFMVRSISCKFEDIVLIEKMTSFDLEKLFFEVLEKMKDYLYIIGVSTDNLATNR